MSVQLTREQLLTIAREYGTPVYVYHAEKIKEQFQKLTSAFSILDTKIFYACKALTNIQILRYVKSLGCNIDCSSFNEVQLALHAGFDPRQILYTSNGVSFSEIQDAVNAGVHVNIDSLSNLEKFGQVYGHDYPVGIRLRPNIMAGGNMKIATGHDRSKFGIPVEQYREILDLLQQYQLHVRTLHLHSGSDIKEPEVFVKGIEILFDLIPHFPELEVLDLGGGFKVPYSSEEKETPLPALAHQLKNAFDLHPLANGKSLQIWFEPGKFLVSECGYLLVSVNVLKDNNNEVFAGVNSGLNHLIRPTLYDAYHRIENLTNPDGIMKPYTVTGYICETDTFATDRMLNQVREGDVLAIYNAGAYGFEMSSNYNSRLKPAEVLVEGGKSKLIRRAEQFEDLLRLQENLQ